MDQERRKYIREMVNGDFEAPEVAIDGKPVEVVNFSVGGLCVRTPSPLEPKKVSIVINSKKSGKINLTGRVIRAEQEDRLWNIAIDLSKQYVVRPGKKP